jgi:SAM-dependent methyltransferase
MSESDDLANIRLFGSLVSRHGCSVEFLNWGSERSQHLRFEILAAIAPLAGMRILDVGCGLGDFYFWLKASGITVDYTGIDITPAMIESASKRIPDSRLSNHTIFEEAALGEKYDYVFSSGIFYLRQHEPVMYLQDSVRTMFEIAGKGVAFNSLSTWIPKQDEGEFYAEPWETLEFCRTLTPRVALRHDYHPGDFSIYLLR